MLTFTVNNYMFHSIEFNNHLCQLFNFIFYAVCGVQKVATAFEVNKL
jgi:hypothetical protein